MDRRLLTISVVLCLVLGVTAAVGATLPPGGTFTDDDGNVHEPSIEAIAEEGITKGCNPPTNDLYCPGETVTRGQMAAFLVRALDLADDGGGNSFVDDDGSVFEADIAKLAVAGITKGCNPPENTKYCPNAAVTRGQMAAFLVRAMGYTDAGAGNLFVDDDDSTFAADIDKLGTAGVTKGCNPPTNDRFCPNSPVKRDQMASFLARALDLTGVVAPPPTTAPPPTIAPPPTEHPQSGDGWALLGCSNDAGTCEYPLSSIETQLEIQNQLLPPDYCIPDPIEPWRCLVSAAQWTVGWFDASDAPVAGNSGPYCTYEYVGVFLTSVTCRLPLDGVAVGEYHGRLCRTVYPSHDCEETLLTTYLQVVP